jgi:zinc transporter ZupT
VGVFDVPVVEVALGQRGQRQCVPVEPAQKVVGLELMPEALNSSAPWLPLLAFVAGGAVFIGLDRAVGYAQARFGGDDKQKGALAIFGGVSMDLFSDGVMIGTGTVINPALGLLLASNFRDLGRFAVWSISRGS